MKSLAPNVRPTRGATIWELNEKLGAELTADEQVDCAQADNAKTCELAQGYPTFVVKGKRCTAGMYPQGTLDKKFEACVAGKYPEEKNNGTMPMCNGAV